MADQQLPQPQEVNAIRVGGLELPPGFRFHPSDDEIVSIYLTNKVRNRVDITNFAIAEVDLNNTEPWDLPRKAKMGEKEWFFFFQKDRKYPKGQRANRATEAGYWKATGRDKEVYNTTEGVMLLVGTKKTLVFYKGRAPRGKKTNWVMHEYRLESSGMLPGPASASSSAADAAAMEGSTCASKDNWVVVCRVFDKTTRIKKMTASVYKVAMASAEIDQNQNNIPAIPSPMPLQQSLPVPVKMQLAILSDFAMDRVPPYYPNVGAGMPPMMPPIGGIGGVGGLQINGDLFSNPLAALPQMSLYHQMGMGATSAGHMGMGEAGPGGFDVVALDSRPSSMVSQKDEQANATDMSSMMDGICELVKN